MSDLKPSATLTVPGICHNLPIEQLTVKGSGHNVTFLNGHAEIILPIGVTATGQEVRLVISDLQFLAELVYAAMLDQARLGSTVAPAGRAA